MFLNSKEIYEIDPRPVSFQESSKSPKRQTQIQLCSHTQSVEKWRFAGSFGQEQARSSSEHIFVVPKKSWKGNPRNPNPERNEKSFLRSCFLSVADPGALHRSAVKAHPATARVQQAIHPIHPIQSILRDVKVT